MQRKYLVALLLSVLLLVALTTIVSADEQQMDTNESSDDILNLSASYYIHSENIKPKIAYVLSRPIEVTFMEKVADYPDISSKMDITVYLGTSNSDLSFDLSNNEMVVLVNLDPYVIEKIAPTVNDAKTNGAYIISNGAALKNYGLHNVNTSDPQYSSIDEYLKYASESNFYGLNTFIGATFFDIEYTIEAPVGRPIYGIYHPAAPQIYDNLSNYLAWYDTSGSYDPEKPTIGIIVDSFTYVERDMPLLDVIVGDIESKGCNAIVTTYSYKDSKSMSYLMSDDKSIADVVIVISRGARLHYSNNAQGIADLEALNVTVMNGVRLFSGVSVEEWENSIHGVPPDQRYQVAFAELDGIIEPIVISGKAIDKATNFEYNEPIAYQIDWMTARAKAWVELHRKPNSEKKILIPYYNSEGGKANIGADIDYYLDAQASLANLLQAMKDRGYNTGEEELPDASEVAAMMIERGHNIGNWAPGELEKGVKNGSAILIPESMYIGWFKELPEDKQQEMNSMWGEAPGNIMVYENSTGKYLVIPVLRFGNILLAPEPMNGWSSSEQAMYNDASYPPTHQSFAFYKYMAEEYQADAIFSIFSTIELMPGKECGLSARDWGAILMQDMPHIHVLPMDALGVFDKRRANMLVIDFMTPTLVPAGLYGELANLQQDITLFNQVSDSTVKEVQRQNILNQTKELNLDSDLGVNLDEIAGNTTLEGAFINELEGYLYELKTAYMPYGSHVLGEIPEGESLVMLIKGMLGDQFTANVIAAGGTEELAVSLLNETTLNSTSVYDTQIALLGKVSPDVESDLEMAVEYLQRIKDSEREISKILDALEGTYITPGPSGDPIRNPDALPTGRNLYAFDDRLIPTKAAWDVGSPLAEELIRIKFEEDGEYPEKVAFVLWSVETTRNQGVMEAEILRLLGVEPVYNFNTKRVTGLNLTDSAELGRPRIDVVVVTSGLYRDMYSSKIQLIDEAIRMAAEAEDDVYPNYVREHSQANYQYLLDNGYDEEHAYNLSVARIFCPASGAYTPGIQEAIMSDTWEDTDKIADLYIERMGYIYGQDLWGEQYSDVFKMNLADVDTAVFSRTSNLYGVLDHTMVAAYFGGLSMAVERAGGNAPDMYINDLSGSAKIETLSKFLSKDLRSRYLNPKWIEGMMNNGFDGTRYMDSVFEVMRVWDVTTPAMVTDDMWNELYDTYFLDKHDTGVTEYLKSTNPYAYESMAATALESVRTGHWDASEEVVRSLVKEYAETIVENGAACCHHTCGNPSLDKFVQGIMSVPGVVDEKTASEYMRIMQEITQNENTETAQESSVSRKSSSSSSSKLEITEPISPGSTNQTAESHTGAGEDFSVQGPDVLKSTPDNYVEGYEMTKESVTQPESSSFSFSGSDIIASILVLVGVGAIYMGFWKRRKM